jgi:hypothetical protein
MERDITPNYKEIQKLAVNYKRMQKQAKRREMIISVLKTVGLALLGLFVAWLLVVGLWAIN